MKLLVSAFILSMTAGTAFASSRQNQDRAAIDKLVKSAKALAASDLSCRSDSDCTVVSYGKRACGGPSGFIVASKNNAHFTELESIARTSQEKEAQYNADYQVMSICSIVQAPVSTCAKKICK